MEWYLRRVHGVGVFIAILSRNSYSVNVDGVIKHISGDNMSHSELSDNDSNVSSDDDTSLSDSDNSSNFSDDSSFCDDAQPSQVQPQLHVQPPRPLQLSPKRTRSGRRF